MIVMNKLEPKLAKAKHAHDSGDLIGCLRIVAKFPRLGAEKIRIERAWSAHTNPEMYRAMGFDVAELVADGIAAIRAKYGWDAPEGGGV
jgi:hypothetical protein